MTSYNASPLELCTIPHRHQNYRLAQSEVVMALKLLTLLCYFTRKSGNLQWKMPFLFLLLLSLQTGVCEVSADCGSSLVESMNECRNSAPFNAVELDPAMEKATQDICDGVKRLTECLWRTYRNHNCPEVDPRTKNLKNMIVKNEDFYKGVCERAGVAQNRRCSVQMAGAHAECGKITKVTINSNSSEEETQQFCDSVKTSYECWQSRLGSVTGCKPTKTSMEGIIRSSKGMHSDLCASEARVISCHNAVIVVFIICHLIIIFWLMKVFLTTWPSTFYFRCNLTCKLSGKRKNIKMVSKILTNFFFSNI